MKHRYGHRSALHAHLDGYQHLDVVEVHVLFRPALMVVGFLMAAIVMEVVGRFFFMTYPLAVSDANTINGWTSILGFLVATGVFFTTSVMIVNTSVNLIHIVPDTVMAWIAPGTQSAGSGSQMGGNFSASAAGVSAYGGGIAQQSMAKNNERLGKARQSASATASAAGEQARHAEILSAMGGGKSGVAKNR